MACEPEKRGGEQVFFPSIFHVIFNTSRVQVNKIVTHSHIISSPLCCVFHALRAKLLHICTVTLLQYTEHASQIPLLTMANTDVPSPLSVSPLSERLCGFKMEIAKNLVNFKETLFQWDCLGNSSKTQSASSERARTAGPQAAAPPDLQRCIKYESCSQQDLLLDLFNAW